MTNINTLEKIIIAEIVRKYQNKKSHEIYIDDVVFNEYLDSSSKVWLHSSSRLSKNNNPDVIAVLENEGGERLRYLVEIKVFKNADQVKRIKSQCDKIFSTKKNNEIFVIAIPKRSSNLYAFADSKDVEANLRRYEIQYDELLVIDIDTKSRILSYLQAVKDNIFNPENTPVSVRLIAEDMKLAVEEVKVNANILCDEGIIKKIDSGSNNIFYKIS